MSRGRGMRVAGMRSAQPGREIADGDYGDGAGGVTGTTEASARSWASVDQFGSVVMSRSPTIRPKMSMPVRYRTMALRCESVKFVSVRLASLRFAYDRFAAVKFVPARLANVRFAPDRSAKLRFM